MKPHHSLGHTALCLISLVFLGSAITASAQNNDVADGVWTDAATWGDADVHPQAGQTYVIDSNIVTTNGTAFSTPSSITVSGTGTLHLDYGAVNGASRTAATDIILDGGRLLFSADPPATSTQTYTFIAENAATDSFTVSSASTIEHNADPVANQQINFVIRSQEFIINDTLTIDINNDPAGAVTAGQARRHVEFENRGSNADISGTGSIRVLGNDTNDRFRIDAFNAASDFEVSVPIGLQSARLQFTGNTASQILVSGNITNINSSFSNSVEISNPTVTISSTGNTYQGDTVVGNNSALNVTGDISSSRNLIDNGDNIVLSGDGTVGAVSFDGARGTPGTNFTKNQNVNIIIGDLRDNPAPTSGEMLTATGDVTIGSVGTFTTGSAPAGGSPTLPPNTNFTTDVTLNIDLFGDGDNDVLAGVGTNTLIFNDILKLNLAGSYLPVYGDEFLIFQNWQTINLGSDWILDTSMAALSPGLSYDITRLASEGIIAIGAPEPGTFLPLLVLAAGLVAFYRPRRACRAAVVAT